MGISNFVTNILSSNNRHASNDISSPSNSNTRRVRHIPTPDPLSPFPLKSRRATRRGRRAEHSPLVSNSTHTPLKQNFNPNKHSNDSDWDSDYVSNHHQLTNKNIISDQSTQFMSPDRETPSNLHRRRHAWRRSQQPRVISNLEASTTNSSNQVYSSNTTSDVDNSPSLQRLFSPRTNHQNNKQSTKIQQTKQFDDQVQQNQDQTFGTFSSFGILNMNQLRREPKEQKSKLEDRSSRDGREDPPRRRRGPGRIRSNIDQLIGRDPSAERRIPLGNSRRRHRRLSSADQFQTNQQRKNKHQQQHRKIVEPLSIANNDVVTDFEHEPETHRGLSLDISSNIVNNNKDSSSKQQQDSKQIKSSTKTLPKRESASKNENSNQSHSTRPKTPSTRPATPLSLSVFSPNDSVSASDSTKLSPENTESSLTEKSNPISDHRTLNSRASGSRPMQKSPPLMVYEDDFMQNEQFPEDSPPLEADVNEPKSVAFSGPVDRVRSSSKNRFSADSTLPNRRKELHGEPFSKNQSNSQPSGVAAKRGLKKVPPPLLTPVGGATGFARGFGADRSGIRDVAGRPGIVPLNVNTASNKHNNGQHYSIIPLKSRHDRSKHRRAKDSKFDEEFSSEGKSLNRLDLWGSDKKSRDSGSFGGRSSMKNYDRDQDLYFEEASQSSFGDTDSTSRIAARNGIASIGRNDIQNEIVEDNFVFGPDGRFNDGGFIISSEGLEEAPERVMRKTSDGLAVDGVPPSSNNLIFVRSLDEFRKSYTFKSKVKNGSSTLGRGAAGRVYLAVHNPTGRKIAVKEINVYDQEKRNQLKKELATLISHQSRFLVKSFGAFYDGAGGVHITLEYMDRGSLADIVQQQGKIPESVMRKIAEHCLRGLCFLHANHILHRDVKTDNILLSRKLCRAKLSDFGLARDLKESEGLSVTDTFVGTLVYMSPERLQGKKYTYASDIWGLGISVLECILGRYPFEKPQSLIDILYASHCDPASLVEGTASDELVDFICQCMHVDPEKRPKAMELLQHPWIKAGQEDSNALRDWLDTIPRLHCENVEVGSELAFSAKAKRDARTKAKLRAKAEEISM